MRCSRARRRAHDRIAESAGGHVINSDRMWHYTEGITNYDRSGRCTASASFPARRRCGLMPPASAAATVVPGLPTPWARWSTSPKRLRLHVVRPERPDHREGVRSVGQEQNPDLTGRSVRQVLARVRPGAPPPVQAFVDKGVDFVTANSLRELVSKMNACQTSSHSTTTR